MIKRVLYWALMLLACCATHAQADEVDLRVAHLAAAPAMASGMPVLTEQPKMDAVQQARLISHRRGVDWYILSLASDWRGKNAPLLTIRGILTSRLAVYAPPDYRAQVKSVFDPALDFAYSRRSMVYALPADLRTDQPIFIAFGQPGQPTPVQASIQDSLAYHAADMHFVRANSFFVAVQISMLLVIGCFWLILRERLYLYFIAYQFFLVVYALTQSGEWYALPSGAFFGAAHVYFSNSVGALVPAFAIPFLLDFAKLRALTPRRARALSIMSGGFVLFGLLLWVPKWLPWVHGVTFVFNLMLIAGALTALSASSSAWRAGNRQAGYFLLSWSPLLLFLIARATQELNAWYLPTWMEYGFAATMAFASLIIVVGLADRTAQVLRERDQAAHLAQSDPLTGELNRRAILTQLNEAWAATDAGLLPMAVLFLDIDHFKQINDRYGHAAGDDCLSAVTDAVRTEIGQNDHVGRFGGEEFLVLLRDDRVARAAQVAERIRARIAGLEVATHGHTVRLTASIGVAIRRLSTASVEALVENADEAQYQAKSQGRNRVVEYQAPPA